MGFGPSEQDPSLFRRNPGPIHTGILVTDELRWCADFCLGAMMPQKTKTPIKELSTRALEALDRARDLAREQGANCCATAHLIFGLTLDHLSLGNRILDDINIYAEMFRDHLKKLPKDPHPGEDDGLHPLVHLAIRRGKEAKQKLKHTKEITSDHLLLGLLSIKEGNAYECLKEFSVEPDEISKEIVEAMGIDIAERPTW